MVQYTNMNSFEAQIVKNEYGPYYESVFVQKFPKVYTCEKVV